MRGRSTGKALLRGSVLSVMSQVARMAVSLITVPLTVGYLGTERYGLWVVTLSTLSFVSLLDVGLAPALKNRMSEALAADDPTRFRRYVTGAFAVGAVVLAVGILLAPLLLLFDWPAIFGASGSVARAEATPLTLAVFAIGTSTLCLAGIEGIYAARMELSVVYAFNLIAAGAGLVLVVLAIRLEAGLPALALASAFPGVAARVALVLRLLARDRSLIMPEGLALWGLLKELLPVSVAFLGIQIGNVLIGALPNLLAARVLGLSEVTVFSVAQRLVSIPLVTVAAVVPVFWPAFTLAWARRDLAWLRRRLSGLIAATVLGLGAYGAGLALFGSFVLELWLRGAVEVPPIVFASFTCWLVLQGASHWITTFLNSISDVRVQVLTVACQACLLLTMAGPAAARAGASGLVVAMAAALLVGSVGPLAWRVGTRLRRGT